MLISSLVKLILFVILAPNIINVISVTGSYVVRSELPELLSKAMKKVTGLEGKVRDLERHNEKLEKR